MLSALGIPRPARLRGRDLGPALAAPDAGAVDDGFALAETDDYELLATGPDRLICERRAAAWILVLAMAISAIVAMVLVVILQRP